MSHAVEDLIIGEVQSRRGHLFERLSDTQIKVDVSLSGKRVFETMDVYEAIEFYEGIQ